MKFINFVKEICDISDSCFSSLRWEAAYPLCLRYLVPVWAPPTALRIEPRMLLFFIHNYCYYHNMIGSLRLSRRQQDFSTGLLSIIEERAKYLRHMSLDMSYLK